MASSKRYILTIFGKDTPEVTCSRFRREEFRDPTPNPKSDPKSGMLRSPLCPEDVLLFETEHDFNDISKAFENQEVILNEGLLLIKGPMTVEAMQKAAREAYPGEKKDSKAYDLYARQISGKSYRDLVKEAKNLVIERFRSAFEETEFEHIMVQSRYNLGLHNRNTFVHPEVVCTPTALKTYKRLAKQGHLYSQYMAGLLLATSTGNYSADCVQYLLDAYQNEHPDAMDLLARFLLIKEDYLGAFQCALLSCESGKHGSREVIRKILGQTSHKMITGSGGMMPASFFLINHCLTEDFKELVRKHTDIEPYDPKNPPMPAFLKRQLGIA
ncbi:hypothetical protein [Pseudomonas amygdali]|nr:hypothetical protein [Pseudomonas amygdali]RMT06172.1 hypothetical protein ALP54_04047 [Pseudomonas amygdali pv. lachrymans]